MAKSYRFISNNWALYLIYIKYVYLIDFGVIFLNFVTLIKTCNS